MQSLHVCKNWTEWVQNFLTGLKPFLKAKVQYFLCETSLQPLSKEKSTQHWPSKLTLRALCSEGRLSVQSKYAHFMHSIASGWVAAAVKIKPTFCASFASGVCMGCCSNSTRSETSSQGHSRKWLRASYAASPPSTPYLICNIDSARAEMNNMQILRGRGSQSDT